MQNLDRRIATLEAQHLNKVEVKLDYSRLNAGELEALQRLGVRYKDVGCAGMTTPELRELSYLATQAKIKQA